VYTGVQVELSALTGIWKWFKWLPKFVLRRVFSKERLSELTFIDVKARHRSVSLNLINKSTFEIYFQIINMSPFEIELDRAEIEFNINGARLKTLYMRKTTFKAGEVSDWFVEGSVDPADADHIAKHYDESNDRASLTLHCDFNCILHNFKKSHFTLDGVSINYINLKPRQKQVA
jgi:hypothetical protein